MKKMLPIIRVRFAIAALFLTLSSTSYSQLSLKTGNMEAGFVLAPSNFLGDLGGNKGKGATFLKDNNLSNTKLIMSGHVSVEANSWLSFRVAASFGTIAGSDALIKGAGGMEEARKARNLSFKSRIAEAYVAGEIYPTVFLEEDVSDVFHKIRPYVIAGIGVFHFNPLGEDPSNGNWIQLKPLHLEGQGFPEYADRKEYKLTQVNVPLGLGIKYYTSDRVSISLEGLFRKTFSDYIDDVSTGYIDPNVFFQHLDQQTAIVATRMADKSVGAFNRNGGEKRGSPNNMDSYYAIGFKLSFRLGGDGFRGMTSMNCPKFKKGY